MTPSLAQPPLDPVIRAVAAIDRRYPVRSLQPGLFVTDTGGWLSATELVRGSGLDDFLDAAQARWHAPRHIAASLAWRCYAYWAALPAVLGYATARRVPRLEPDQVLLRYQPTAPLLRVGLRAPAVAVLPGDPLLAGDRLPADRAGLPVPAVPAVPIEPVPDEAALLDTLRASLADRHLVPLLDAIRTRVRVGRRTLWGSLASGVATAVSRAADLVPGSVTETATVLLSTLQAADLVDITEGPDRRLTIRRHTCCLAFVLPGERICTGCCISSGSASCRPTS